MVLLLFKHCFVLTYYVSVIIIMLWFQLSNYFKHNNHCYNFGYNNCYDFIDIHCHYFSHNHCYGFTRAYCYDLSHNNFYDFGFTHCYDSSKNLCYVFSHIIVIVFTFLRQLVQFVSTNDLERWAATGSSMTTASPAQMFFRALTYRPTLNVEVWKQFKIQQIF